MPLTIMLHLAAKRGYHLSAVSPFLMVMARSPRTPHCHCEPTNPTLSLRGAVKDGDAAISAYDPTFTLATIWSRFSLAMLLIEISLGQADSHSA